MLKLVNPVPNVMIACLCLQKHILLATLAAVFAESSGWVDVLTTAGIAFEDANVLLKESFHATRSLHCFEGLVVTLGLFEPIGF